MTHKRKTSKIVRSIEDASILRKFSILFLLMSIIPTTVLYYIYLQVRDQGQVSLTAQEFNVTLIFIIFGVMVGFVAMRAVLKKVIDLTHQNRKILKKILSPEQLREISSHQNEIALIARSFMAITERLEENVRSLESAKQTLHAVMSKVGQGIANMQNIDTFLELILESVTEAISGRVGVLMLVDSEKNELWVKAAYGMEFDRDFDDRIPLEKGTALHTMVESKAPIIIQNDEEGFSHSSAPNEIFAAPMICAPLVSQDTVRGIIAISGRTEGEDFEEEEMNLLFNLASQTAVALENSQLNQDIESTYFETISALALAVDAKDKYYRGHLDRVARYCILIGKKLGLEPEEINTLSAAAKLHDLGKIGIPDDVLRKGEPLTDQEWILMKKHPEIGETIIKPIRSLHHLCDLIRHHHEKLDGSGYPDHLRGSAISPLVRIIAIADIYDALTTKRSYRDGDSPREAFQELRQMRDKIDQDIVDILEEALDEDSPAEL